MFFWSKDVISFTSDPIEELERDGISNSGNIPKLVEVYAEQLEKSKGRTRVLLGKLSSCVDKLLTDIPSLLKQVELMQVSWWIVLLFIDNLFFFVTE